MNPTDPAKCSTLALTRQDRLDAWAKEAALCLLDGNRQLAQFCLDEIACIRRETTIDWSES